MKDIKKYRKEYYKKHKAYFKRAEKKRDPKKRQAYHKKHFKQIMFVYNKYKHLEGIL